MAKHDSLRQFLDHKGTRMLTLSFSQIADLVGGLPESAYQYREMVGKPGLRRAGPILDECRLAC
jgi:hypothetical protein